MIELKTISSMDELLKSLNELPNNYIYRGHADADWRLESTLERVLGTSLSNSDTNIYEEHYLNLFKSKYHIYNDNNHEPKSKLAWLSVMQHYGAPTRLIDFTESPYISLYFALEAYNPQSKKDLAIYALDYSSIMDQSLEFISQKDSSFKFKRLDIIGKQDHLFEDVVDRFSYEVVWITEPLELNIRIDRQSGTFLISGDRKKRIEDLLSLELYKNTRMIKFKISYELYHSIYALLRKMNINSKSIYGDLSGLAKSIKMDMQVHVVPQYIVDKT
ncbi:FRG domain-containing protein [Dickeya zeae]|uniref:FRG domain-containing protein n=1 Tax=Dickeya zeae TaxID=204042 RepID=UPI000C9B0289|nr:FRG domain-containing protein [Dickeya zeae]AUQ27074.1 FRG domain-containing protein [Dickeya zeae]UJR60129.1 FRG domain-containing protein [Dickeya zeae]